MPFTPLHGDHAISEVIFQISLDRALTPAEVGALGERHQELIEDLPSLQVLLFTITCLGMSASHLSKLIEDRRKEVKEWLKDPEGKPKPGLDWDLLEFVYPFLVSVVTFGAVIEQIADDAFSAATIVIAFQTDFFWQTILAFRSP